MTMSQDQLRGLAVQLEGLRHQAVQLEGLRHQAVQWNQIRDQVAALAHLHIQTPSLLNGFEGYVRQVDSVVEQLSVASTARPEERIPPTETLPNVRPPVINWPPLSLFALRVLLATITLALVMAVWEEGKDTAPATTLAIIYSLFAAWNEIDKDL